MNTFMPPRPAAAERYHDVIETVLDLLPIAVLLFDRNGSVLQARGGLAHLFDERIPSRMPDSAVRWEVIDHLGKRLDPSQWPDALALDGGAEQRAMAMCFPPDGEPFSAQWVALPSIFGSEGEGAVLLVESLNEHRGAEPNARQLLETNLMGAFTAAIERACKDGSVLALGLLDKRALRSRDPNAHTPDELTPREREVLKLIAWGLGNKEIAAELGIGVKTVEFHRARGIERLGLKAKRDVVRYAVTNGWLDDC